MMRFLGRWVLACVLLLMSASSARAAAILTVSGANDATTIFSPPADNGVYGIAFSTASDYTNVDITLYFANFFTDSTLDLDVFLTDQIGPGTTASNEIASASLSIPIAASGVSFPYTITPFAVLSGLSLSADTYYLTFVRTGATAGTTPHLVLSNPGDIGGDPGSSLVAGFLTGNPDPTYAPASEMADLDVGDLWVSINGTLRQTTDSTSVPEPASLLLLGTGIVGAAARRLRRGVRGSTR